MTKAEIEKRIAEYNFILSDRYNVLQVVKKEIRELGEIYGDERRTQIIERELDDSSPEDFIKKEEVVVNISSKGFAKRLAAEEYKAQNRGGKGTIGAKLVDGDFVDHLITCSSHDIMFFVSNLGKAYYAKAYEIPESAKTSKGTSLKTFLQFENGEKATSIITFPQFEEDLYLLMVTKNGVTKRVRLMDFINAKTKGVKAIILDEGDELIQSIFVKEEDDVMFITRGGKGLRTPVSEIRTMGRATHGVRGIKLIGDDSVVGLVRVDADKSILMITEKGKGKRVRFDDFSAHGRGTMGQRIYTLQDDDGLVNALSVAENEDVIFMTLKGQIIRVHVESINLLGKTAMGVIVAKFKKKDDKINVMAITEYQESDPEESEQPVSEE